MNTVEVLEQDDFFKTAAEVVVKTLQDEIKKSGRASLLARPLSIQGDTVR